MAANETSISTDSGVKKSKHRSPNYPAIGLEKAIERAQTIKEEAGRNFMPVSVAHNLWGYKKGAGDQQVAALKAFGLVETQGESDKRQIKLSEKGWRILGEAPDRAALLKEAALKPGIHREIWDKYSGELPKSDAIIRDWLVWDKGFNQSFVDAFIAQFRATIAFVNLSLSDKVAPDETPKPQEKGKQSMNPALSSGRTDPPPPPPPPVGQRIFPLYLSAEQEAALYVPSKMRQSEYELLKTQIENSLLVMRATSVIPDPTPETVAQPSFPMKAMWRNKDHDQPVTITGELGEKDGKRFYAANETTTGIPENELEFENAQSKGAA
jgi:hypothetical protein